MTHTGGLAWGQGSIHRTQLTYIHPSRLFPRSDFGKMVAREYLRFFEFDKMSLVESLRQFLSCFSLTGESQERERIMVHFSDRYHECNPDVFQEVGESYEVACISGPHHRA